jgi:hypothetical protein
MHNVWKTCLCRASKLHDAALNLMWVGFYFQLQQFIIAANNTVYFYQKFIEYQHLKSQIPIQLQSVI